MFKRLLVPLDGSRLAESILPPALYFAGQFGATIVLFHVIEASAPAEVHGERHLTADSEARTYLAGLVERMARPDLHIEFDVHPAREADVARSITEHAQELKADLVMLCAHGSGGLRDVLVGSIAQQAIQRGTTPVFLMRPQADGGDASFSCKSILLPLDGSPVHEPALAVAAEIARACDANLHLFTVVPTAGTLSPERSATSVLLPSTMAAVLDMAQGSAVEYLQNTMNGLVAKGLKVSAEVVRGDSAQCILDETSTLRPDLVVLATHGRTNLVEFWTGGVTPKILSHSTAPVLLVRVMGEETPR